MDYKDIPTQLVAIHSALVEKIEGQPLVGPSMRCAQSGMWTVALYGTAEVGGNSLGTASGTSPSRCIKAAFDLIEKMPDPATKKKQDWQGKLGKVIDEGHALNLPDEVMSPLRQGSQAMTENLLAEPGVEVSG